MFLWQKLRAVIQEPLISSVSKLISESQLGSWPCRTQSTFPNLSWAMHGCSTKIWPKGHKWEVWAVSGHVLNERQCIFLIVIFFPVDWNVDTLTRTGGAISAQGVCILGTREQNVRRWLSPWCHVNHANPRLFISGLSLCVGKTHFYLFKISGFLKFSVTPTWF